MISKDNNKRDNSSWKRNKKNAPSDNNLTRIDYKDPRGLQKFTSERGRIMPARISSISARKQRALALAIKRARYLALLPYISD